MENYTKTTLLKLIEERKSYSNMIDYCCDNLILNNHLVEDLNEKGFYFDVYTGSVATYYNKYDEEITQEAYEKTEGEGSYYYDEIYQYYIISEQDAERLETFTDELVIYNDDLEIYLLCVKHFGTSWTVCAPNWKTPDEMPDEI